LHDSPAIVRFGLPPVAILQFSDVLYVSYLNSFYMDAASLVFLLLTAALATAAILRPRRWIAIAFSAAGVLLAVSKTQHVFTAAFFGAFAAWLAWQAFKARQPIPARLWAGSSGAILAAVLLAIALSPADYKAEPFYSVIFYNLLPVSGDSRAALAELGLPPEDVRLVGTHAYSPESPVTQPEWREDFIRRVGYSQLVSYYVRHPEIAADLLYKALINFAPAMRPGNLANYEQEDGFAPDTLARHFSWWSTLRGQAIWRAPLHLAVVWLITTGGALLCLAKRKWASLWRGYPLALVLAVSSAIEFLLAVLFDGTETARHLFFFHALTELQILSLAGGLFAYVNWYKARGLACRLEPASGNRRETPENLRPGTIDAPFGRE
jgi:hypothetical protein